MRHRTSLLAQLFPTPRDPAANAARAAEIVLVHQDLDLVVFPELFLSGYALEGIAALATEPSGPELGRVRDAAAQAHTAVLIGFAEPVAGGVSNSAACIDSQGSLVGIYRKLFLFGAEADAFVPGEQILVANLDGEWVAPLICFDVEFPEAARSAAMAGAQLLVTISANMEPYLHDHELHSRARALENRLPHLYANRVGAESGFDFVGGSRSIAPTGEALAEAGAGEELLLAPIAEVAGFDEQVDYLRFVQTIPPARRVGPGVAAAGEKEPGIAGQDR